LRQRFPECRFFRAPAGTTVFALRSLGIAQARGRCIALTEDHCTAAPQWLQELPIAFRRGAMAAGGPGGDGPRRNAYDRARYCCEYGRYMPPVGDGQTPALSGVNVAYQRDALWTCRNSWQEAFYENELHDALRAKGYPLQCVARAWVQSHLAMDLGEAM